MEMQARCPHVSQISEVEPGSPDSCEECVTLGDSWVNLRICLVCGHVGCCDNSKNRHARRHFHDTQHAIIQSYEPGEAWRYCYIDDMALSEGKPFRSQEAP